MRSTHPQDNRRSALADFPGGRAPETPTVGIAVPIFNEIRHLDALLADIRAQDYPAIKEIWLVDGLSDDGTYEALHRHAAADPKIKPLLNRKRLPAAALNMAFARMKTDIVMRLDAHARYEPDVVRRSVEALLATGAGGVGPIARPLLGSTPVERAIVLAHLSRIGVGVAQFRREGSEGWVDSIWNGCYWRHVVEKVGDLREDLWRAEDNEFNARVRQAGYGLYLSPAIRAHYLPRQSLPALWSQYFSNGVGMANALFANPKSVSLRHFAPFVLVAALIGSLLLGVVVAPLLLLFAAIVAIYLVALVAAIVAAARQRSGAQLLLLPAALATIHVSYGCGTL